jgi:hypothetical protein
MFLIRRDAMSTTGNPFIRGYHNLTIQRQLVVHVTGDCPVIHRPLHPSQASLSDEQLHQSACRFNDKHAVVISGLPLDPRLKRACHHEGTVIDVIHAVIAIEAEGPVHVGDTHSPVTAYAVAQRLSFETGHYSRCWEINSAHLCSEAIAYLQNLALSKVPTGLLFEVFQLVESSAIGCKLYSTPWNDKTLLSADGRSQQQLRQEHSEAGIPASLIQVLHLAALADTRILIFDPDAAALEGLPLFDT